MTLRSTAVLRIIPTQQGQQQAFAVIGQGRPMSTTARRERERLKRRREILDAARELFSEKGYAAATVDEIAAAAELSKGTVYLYFQSKDELYASVILEGFEKLEGRLGELAALDLPVEKKVESILRAFIEHCTANPEYFRLTQLFAGGSVRDNLPEGLREEIDSHARDLLRTGAEVVRKGMEEGVFREDLDPFMASLIAWRTLTGLLDLVIFGGGMVRKKDLGRLLDQALDLFMRGARREREAAGGGAAGSGAGNAGEG